MEHKHDAYITLSNQVICRTCGQILPFLEERVAKVQSERAAKRVIEEVAAAGKYRIVTISQGFAVYADESNGLVVELTIRETGDREFEVIKTTRMKEVV